MKRNLLFIAAAMFVSQFVHAQQQTPAGLFSSIMIKQNPGFPGNSIFYHDTTLTGEYYLQRSKNQKTAAWVMLGGGVALTIVGVVGLSSTYSLFEESSAADTYAVLTLVGTGLSLGSIPIFLASGRNHRKAAALSVKNQHIFIPQQDSYVFKSQPAVSLVIPL